MHTDRLGDGDLGVPGLPSDGDALASAINPSQEAQRVAVTASVANTSGAETPTGSIDFLEGTTVLATVPLQSDLHASLVTALAVGDHALTAAYSGDDTHLPAPRRCSPRRWRPTPTRRGSSGSTRSRGRSRAAPR